jgi:flagellar export protein FliJ
MKRFHFSLRPVAVLRAHRELQAQDVFAASVRAFVKSEETLAGVRQRVAQFEASLFDGRRERFSAAEEVQALAAYRTECVAEAAAERETLAARELMQRRRAEYVEAHRKVEVVKRLETKARAAHRVECNREEQASFDEFASRRFMNRQPALAT